MLFCLSNTGISASLHILTKKQEEVEILAHPAYNPDIVYLGNRWRIILGSMGVNNEVPLVLSIII